MIKLNIRNMNCHAILQTIHRQATLQRARACSHSPHNALHSPSSMLFIGAEMQMNDSRILASDEIATCTCSYALVLKTVVNSSSESS